MKKKNNFMGTRPVFSLLISMSVPMMLSMLIQSLYNIVDSIYVSRLGTEALTAVSLAFPLQNAATSVAVGIGVGISSSISIHLGSENQEKANRAAVVGLALTVFHFIFSLCLQITLLYWKTRAPTPASCCACLSARYYRSHLKKFFRASAR